MLKLGKKPPKMDRRTLRLERYLTDSLPVTPPSCDWSGGRRDWGMMMNDQLGCCTISAVGHAMQTLAGYTPSDPVVEYYYSDWDGYVRGDPNTDQGGVELDVLNKWRQHGFNNHKLVAYADPAPRSITHVKQSVYFFGGLYIGLALPLSAQYQQIWTPIADSDGAAGSWGGHAVWCVGYDTEGITCVTWGGLKKMTWGFWHAYCDEAHTLVVPEWGVTWDQDGQVPLKTDELMADLNLITG